MSSSSSPMLIIIINIQINNKTVTLCPEKQTTETKKLSVVKSDAWRCHGAEKPQKFN